MSTAETESEEAGRDYTTAADHCRKRTIEVFAGLTRSIAIGLAVGIAWLPACFLACVFFYALRDFGILLLLPSIPAGAIITWLATRRYLQHETNPFRGAIALSARYFFLGAAVGFFFAGCACSVANTTFLGGAVGAMVGSLGGAFQGWLRPHVTIRHLVQ